MAMENNRNSSVSHSNFQMKDINSYITRTLSDVLFPTSAADDFYTSHCQQLGEGRYI